jgi:glycosyltransferase involved in cell wall biosynthesis
MLVEQFDHTLAVTAIDREMLMKAVYSGQHNDPQASSRDVGETHPPAPSITIIPIAVDTQVLKPISRQPGSCNIVTLGTLHYPPNADGIRWFAREVFPQVCREFPEATLTIIGKNPPADFQELAANQPEKYQVTGYVPNLVPYLERAALMVVPVRAGSGMRVRILEAFAQAMPMVTTTIGLEGIDAVPGEEILVADNVQDFTEAVGKLLKDVSLQTRLAHNGRSLAETLYDWRVVLRKLDMVYASA